MSGIPVPEEKRQAILDWYQRKREIGTFKSIARKLQLPEPTVKDVIFRSTRSPR